MKNCTKMLVAAVMGISMSTAAFGQPAQNGVGAASNAGGATPPTGTGATGAGQAGEAPNSNAAAGSSTNSPSGTGSSSGTSGGTSATGDNTTGGATGGGMGTAGGTPSTPRAERTDTTGTGTPDAMGAASSAQSRDMQRGAMGAAGGTEADRKMMTQLDKIATMGEKSGDALFVLAAANGNLFEVEAAKAAQQKSQNPKVKELATMIEKDHAAANEKLRPIAQKMGLEFPTALPSEKQKMLAIAAAMEPEAFDTHYVLHNKAAHAKEITSFSDCQKAAKDEALRFYISETLPKLKEHGMMIQTLASEMGYSSPMGGGAMSGDMRGMNHGGGMTGSSGTSSGTSGSTSGGMGGASGTSGTSGTGGTSGGMNSGTGASGASGASGGMNPPTNNQNPSNR